MFTEKYWHENYDPERGHPNMRSMDELLYVGVTGLSIVVTTKDGITYRITNPDFTAGLHIEVREGND